MNSTTANIKGGQLLATLRQAAKLTQVELAQGAKVSRSMVAQLETGERRPSRKLVHVLCQSMNASVEDEQQLLLAYAFSPSGETPEQIAAFLRADKNLTPDQAENIVGLVRKAYERALSERQKTEFQQ